MSVETGHDSSIINESNNRPLNQAEHQDNPERRAKEKIIPIFETPGVLYHRTGCLEVVPVLFQGILSHEMAQRK